MTNTNFKKIGAFCSFFQYLYFPLQNVFSAKEADYKLIMKRDMTLYGTIIFFGFQGIAEEVAQRSL